MKYAILAVAALVLASADAAKDGPQFRYMRFPHKDVRINLTESRVAPYTLEDPLAFADGRKVETPEDWAARRREILGVFEREMYGRMPPAPETLVTDLVDEKTTFGGKMLRRQHDMYFRADRTGPKIRWITFIPKDAKGPVPVILMLNYHGNQSLVADPDIPMMTAWHRNGRWAKDNRVIPESRGLCQRPQDSDTVFPLEEFVRRGYAVMSACYCEVSPDPNRTGDEDPREMQDAMAYTGVFELWPPRDPKGKSETTSLGAWSWALSRGLDLAERQREIDAKRSVVTGCSRLAKAALIAAAYDDRFAVCAPVQTGGGGVPLAKRDFGENVGSETRAFTHWYCRAYGKYAGMPWKSLTFDQHLLVAAIAPRPLLVLGFNEKWFDPHGEFLSCRAASCVWEKLCGEGLPEGDFPETDSVRALGRRLGYVRRDGPHAITAKDWGWILDFADVQFGRLAEFPKPPVSCGGLQEAIDAAAAKGGGRVVVPAGRHLTKGLVLKSNVEIHLEKGAVLEGSGRLADYPMVTLPCSEGEWRAVVMAVGQTNVAVTGEGEIYGNGSVFKVDFSRALYEGMRPRGLFFGNCRGVRLEDFSLRDSACWGVVVQCCEDVAIRRLKIDNHANYNNDGIDIEARNAVIEGCDIDSGDDGICLKSNNPDFVMENVLVTNCTVRSFMSAIKLGTASHGVVRNVLVTDCRTSAPRRDHDAAASDPLRYAPANWRDGWAWRDYPCATEAEPAAMAALAVECVDGGLVEDFTFRGIEIDGGCYSPVLVRAGIRGPRATGAPRGRHNVMRRIAFEDIHGYALSGVPSIVTGVPGFRIKDVAFRNVHLTGRGVGNHAALNELSVPEYEDHYPMGGMFLQAMPAYGLYARHVDGLVLENADFATDTRKDVVLEDATCTSKDIK